MHFAFSYAVQAARMKVNTETGEVKVLKVVAAHNIGRAINPLTLKGQIEGGIVMGVDQDTLLRAIKTGEAAVGR